MKPLTMRVYMPYRRPTSSMIAHMKGMVMGGMLVVGLGTRLRPSARAPELDYAPREPPRRYAPMYGAKGATLSELLYARTRLECLCVSIPKHTWYYPVVWHPLIYRAVPLSRHHNLKTVTLELSCALGYDPSPTRTRGSARLYGTKTPVFEHH